MKRRDVSDPKVKEHLGRIVKTTGDGLLIEFASVIDAVRCAVEVQRMMAERNAIVPAEQRIEFRVGINLGDIIIEEGDISATGSMSRRASKLWPRPAASASAGWCAIVCATGLIALSKTRATAGQEHTRPVRAYVLSPEAVADLPVPNVLPAMPLSPSPSAARLSILVLPIKSQ
jgi:adenylate cyclase